jgi:hypothetical protein
MTRHRTRLAVAAALVVGFLISATMVWRSSRAAFYHSTENHGNSWSTGAVELSDNDSGAALFVPSVNMQPGGPPTASCITVTYGGSVAAKVRLYVKPPDLTGTLGRYLSLTVEEGTVPATFGSSCTGFSAPVTSYSGTVADFAATNSDFVHSAGGWAPTGANQTKGYRFTVGLVDDNDAQNRSATVTFTWEAQSLF